MDAPLVIEFTPEESERLRERARLHGYDDAAAYVRMALLEEDDWEDDDKTILAGLRTGWQQAQRGDTVTWEEFVNEVKASIQNKVTSI